MVDLSSSVSRRSVPGALTVSLPAAGAHSESGEGTRASRAALLSTSSVGAIERSQLSFDVPSPSAASIGGQSLLYEPLPADLLWPVRPASPSVAPVLNIGVNRLALFRAVDAHVESVVEANRARHQVRAKTAKRAERRTVAQRELTVDELVDEQCASAAAFHYQQQLRLDVSHRPQLLPSSDSSVRVSDTVRSLTANSSSAHRYRLYTDSLIDVGLHHEAELRRQWIAMETQARSINRSAERAARRDMRESVREIVNAAKAGKCNEVRDKLKEATQHVDEANEARNSRAAIYKDDKLYLPLSRSRQRKEAVMASMTGEKSSIGHLNSRQPLFDPVPQASEFDHHAEQHVCFHSFRDDDSAGQRNETDIALPAVVHQMKRTMEALEEEREDRRREDDKLKRLHRAEKRKQNKLKRMQQLQLAAQQHSGQPKSPSQPLAPPSSAATLYSARGERRPHSVATVGRSSTAATMRRGSIRAPLWTQGQGDEMLAEVSQFTLLRSKEEERRKEDERRAIAEEEKRTREQWLADEQRELREREEKEQADRERRQREREEDEREDRERRQRYFPSQQQPSRCARDRTETEGAMRGVGESTDRRDNSESSDLFSATSPLPATRSPERTYATLSASDVMPRRRSSIAAVAARRMSVAAAGGLPGIGHRRHSSLLPPSSPALSSARTSTTSRSYRSSLATSAFPLSQVRSRWQNAAGRTGKEHLARRFSLVAANDSAQQQPPHLHPATQQQPHYHQPAMAAMLPAPIDPDSSLVATNYSHDPLHSSYLQQQREQRRTATAQVYDTVKKWLEEQEEERTSTAAAAVDSGGAPNDRAASLSFDPQLVTPFSSILAHQPYSPRSQQRHRSMRQRLPLSVSNPAVFAWMRRHAIVPRRTIDPSEEVKVSNRSNSQHSAHGHRHAPREHNAVCETVVDLLFERCTAAFARCAHSSPHVVRVVAVCLFQYRAMFNELDVDGSGLLDTSELLSALAATHNLRLSEDELHQLLTGMDIRFQGHLSFQQFVSQFASMDEWESLFRIWAKRRQKRMAAAAQQPNIARSRPATSPPTDRTVSQPLVRPTVLPAVAPLLTARPASSASITSLRASSSSSSATSSSRPSSSTHGGSTAIPAVDVLVPFLLWVPAFHRLQLLESLMAVHLTPEEEAAVRQSAEQQQSAPSAADGASSGLSLLDLWRVTRTQVRRKRMESEKAEAMRIKQLQAAEGARGAGAGGGGGGKKSKGAAADRSHGDGGSGAEEEKVMEIWLELHGERERRLEEKRRWRAAHKERKLRRAGDKSGEDSETDGHERMEAFDIFKQAAQLSLDEQMQ